ncbi:MAG: hypothetical protein WA003_17305 [Desulfuromonadaceae bacterium]
MWKKFRENNKDYDAGALEQMRFMCAVMGFAFAFFTIYLIVQGTAKWDLSFIVMALLSIAGLIGFVAYSKLVKERTSIKKEKQYEPN